MKSSNYKYTFVLLFLFAGSILRGQDGKASIELDRDEQLQFGFYAKNNGLWLVTNGSVYPGQVPPAKIYKYSPDLSKEEWTLDIKGIYSRALYDEKNPDYIYFRSANAPSNQLLAAKLRFFQVNKAGKLKTYDIQKEKDEDAKDDIVAFTSMNHFCEFWTKKKSDNELILVLHDNETFKRSKKTIKLPNNGEKVKYQNWVFAGSSDNLAAFTRHEKEESERLQVVLIDMNAGKVINHFSYTPKLKEASTKLVDCPIYRNKRNATEIYQDHTSDYSTKGNIMLSDDGKRFYHYGVIAYDTKAKTSINFVYAQLDLEGKKMLQQELTYNNKDLAGKILGTLYLEETDAQFLNLQIVVGSMQTTIRVALLLDLEGKIQDRCIKDSQIKGSFRGSKSTVNSIEDLYPCFIKNPARITKYIEEKRFDGGYGVISDGEQHVISISLPKDRVIGLIYFKN